MGDNIQHVRVQRKRWYDDALFKDESTPRMMLQHGLYHLHIIETEVVEVVVRTNEKVAEVAELVILIKTKKKEVAEVVEIVG